MAVNMDFIITQTSIHLQCSEINNSERLNWEKKRIKDLIVILINEHSYYSPITRTGSLHFYSNDCQKNNFFALEIKLYCLWMDATWESAPMHHYRIHMSMIGRYNHMLLGIIGHHASVKWGWHSREILYPVTPGDRGTAG